MNISFEQNNQMGNENGQTNKKKKQKNTRKNQKGTKCYAIRMNGWTNEWKWGKWKEGKIAQNQVQASYNIIMIVNRWKNRESQI